MEITKTRKMCTSRLERCDLIFWRREENILEPRASPAVHAVKSDKCGLDCGLRFWTPPDILLKINDDWTGVKAPNSPFIRARSTGISRNTDVDDARIKEGIFPKSTICYRTGTCTRSLRRKDKNIPVREH